MITKNKKATIAITQILILIIGMFAIAYALGSGFGTVSAADNDGKTNWALDGQCGYEAVDCGSSSKCCAGGEEGNYCSEKNYDCAGNPLEESSSDGDDNKITYKDLASFVALKNEIKKVRKQIEDLKKLKEAKEKVGFLEKQNLGILKKIGNFVWDKTKGTWEHISPNIIKAGVWATVVYAGVTIIGNIFDNITDYQVQKYAEAAGLGTLVGFLVAGPVGVAAGIVTGIAYLLTFYHREKEKAISYECLPWQAQKGGENCEKCNDQGIFPCTEYMCKSLGQGCEIINKGTTQEQCVWVNEDDIKYPIIRPWVDALLDDYRYNNPNAVSPPDSGVDVLYTNSKQGDGCSPAFTPFTFGVMLDEPAQCKIDYTRKQTFEEMDFFMGGSNIAKYNHSQTISLPGVSNLEAEELLVQNGGEYEMYVRCEDTNGNSNVMDFAFKFCVDDGPDTTPPLIIGTDWINGAPIPFDLKEVDIELYVNEPAECKWSHENKEYENMENTLTCPNSVTEQNAQMIYTCTTTLNGLQNLVENDFYFRCKDQPVNVEEKHRNVNEESYKLTLVGTRELIINEVGPNETIRGSTDPIKVTLEAETSAGWNEGQATCYYNDEDKDSTYLPFQNTDSHEHSTDLWLSEGNYKYYIRCMDLGGNFATEEVEFNVEIDLQAPTIVRVYHEGSYLKIITDENATCVYSTDDCNYLFEDGLSIAVVDEINHFTDWKTDKNFYVKCQDAYSNRPSPNQCSMIVRPFELYSFEED